MGQPHRPRRRAGRSAVRLTCPVRCSRRRAASFYVTKYQFSGLIDSVDDCGVTPLRLFAISVSCAAAAPDRCSMRCRRACHCQLAAVRACRDDYPGCLHTQGHRWPGTGVPPPGPDVLVPVPDPGGADLNQNLACPRRAGVGQVEELNIAAELAHPGCSHSDHLPYSHIAIRGWKGLPWRSSEP
jgi:hypothetical protein